MMNISLIQCKEYITFIIISICIISIKNMTFSVNSALICAIQTGIIAYVGFSVNDTEKDAEYM